MACMQLSILFFNYCWYPLSSSLTLEVSRVEKREAKKMMMRRAGMRCIQMLTLSLCSMKRLVIMRLGVEKLMRYPPVMYSFSLMNEGAVS